MRIADCGFKVTADSDSVVLMLLQSEIRNRVTARGSVFKLSPLPLQCRCDVSSTQNRPEVSSHAAAHRTSCGARRRRADYLARLWRDAPASARIPRHTGK